MDIVGNIFPMVLSFYHLVENLGFFFYFPDADIFKLVDCLIDI